jgi:hypothetical protein
VTQDRLDLFEGERVELCSVRFVGDPDAIVDPTPHSEMVAFIVLGQVSEVSFPKTDDGSMVRRHKVSMRRVLQIDHADGLLMLDEQDRKRREAQGIHGLPFGDH